MSKASEWARRVTQTETAYKAAEQERLEWLCPHGGCHAKVSPVGSLLVVVSDHNHVAMTPEDALSLARWILDTFGEPS